MAKLTELQRYPNNAAACLVQGRLSQDGIQSSVRRGSRYQAMGGSGYVVSVRAEDLDKARKILSRINPEVDLDEYVDPNNTSMRRCPLCRSVMITRLPLEGTRRRMVMMTAGLGLLFVLKDYRCKKCGHRWEMR